MTELGGGIDELDLNLFSHPVASSWEERLSKNDWSLLCSKDLTSDEKIVLVDLTIVGETAHRGDVLLNSVSSGGGVVGNTTDLAGSEAIDLFVDLGTGVVTHLTSTSDRPFDGSGMPSTDTTDLTETSVSLTLKLLGAESLDNTLETFTLGNTNSIDALVGFKNFANRDLLFELGVGPVNLLLDGATIDLDFHNAGFVLAEVELANLSSSKAADDSAVLLNALHFSVN